MEGLFVQSTEISAKESGVFTCVSEVCNHTCVRTAFYTGRDPVLQRHPHGTAPSPADFTSPLFSVKGKHSWPLLAQAGWCEKV